MSLAYVYLSESGAARSQDCRSSAEPGVSMRSRSPLSLKQEAIFRRARQCKPSRIPHLWNPQTSKSIPLVVRSRLLHGDSNRLRVRQRTGCSGDGHGIAPGRRARVAAATGRRTAASRQEDQS